MPRRLIKMIPIVIKPVPMIGYFLYFPYLEIHLPLVMDDVRIPSMKGINFNPAVIAVEP